jgi:hypothetical protein
MVEAATIGEGRYKDGCSHQGVSSSSVGGNLAAALLARANDGRTPWSIGRGAGDAGGRPHRVRRFIQHEPGCRFDVAIP